MSLVVWTSLSVSPSKCSAALFNLSKIREVSTSAAAIFSPLRTSSSVLQADHHGLPGGLSYIRCRISSEERVRSSLTSACILLIALVSSANVDIARQSLAGKGSATQIPEVQGHLWLSVFLVFIRKRSTFCCRAC